MTQPNDQFAEVRLSAGRQYLRIADLVIVVEGDPVRDQDISGRAWTAETLQQVADLINAEQEKWAARSCTKPGVCTCECGKPFLRTAGGAS